MRGDLCKQLRIDSSTDHPDRYSNLFLNAYIILYVLYIYQCEVMMSLTNPYGDISYLYHWICQLLFFPVSLDRIFVTCFL